MRRSVSRILKPFSVSQIPTWIPRVFLDFRLNRQVESHDVFVECGDRLPRGYLAVWDQLNYLPADSPIVRFGCMNVVDGRGIVFSADLRRLIGVMDEDGAERRLLLTIKQAEWTFDVPTWDIDNVDMVCTVLLQTFY